MVGCFSHPALVTAPDYLLPHVVIIALDFSEPLVMPVHHVCSSQGPTVSLDFLLVSGFISGRSRCLSQTLSHQLQKLLVNGTDRSLSWICFSPVTVASDQWHE